MTAMSCFVQTKFDTSVMTEEFNFFYKDSIDNIVSFGDYEPTGFVGFNSGSIIVSTEFSIHFPRQYQLTDSFNRDNFKLVYEEDKIFQPKEHISSGSVFKLNSSFHKEWELIFEDKRVKKIEKLPDGTIIIAGDRIDMGKYWMVQLDTTGKIIWQREFKIKYSSTVSNMTIDSLGNSYILLETERVVPFSTEKYWGKRRFHFFRPTEMENNIYLVKADNNGKVLWRRCLDNRKNFGKFGYNIFINHDVFVTTSYEGFIKHKKDWIKQEGSTLHQITTKGKVIKATESNKYFQYHYNDNYFSCTTKSDTLTLYTTSNNQQIPTDTIIFSNPIQSVWIEKFFKTKDCIYLLGSKDHNLGYIVVQLDKDNNYISHWNDSRKESCELVDAIKYSDNTFLVIGKCFKKEKDANNELITYINLTRISHEK